jgi:hypothetical protein
MGNQMKDKRFKWRENSQDPETDLDELTHDHHRMPGMCDAVRFGPSGLFVSLLALSLSGATSYTISTVAGSDRLERLRLIRGAQ